MRAPARWGVAAIPVDEREELRADLPARGEGAWVAGYATTASLSMYNTSTWNSGEVTTYVSALQSDGSTRTYYGTYYVSNGVITSAGIAQTS